MKRGVGRYKTTKKKKNSWQNNKIEKKHYVLIDDIVYLYIKESDDYAIVRFYVVFHLRDNVIISNIKTTIDIRQETYDTGISAFGKSCNIINLSTV